MENIPSQKDLPNATAILILGILSIIGCWVHGIPGLILSIIAIVLAGKDLKRYHRAPERYTVNSLGNLKAGRICAIIGLILSSIVFIVVLIYFLIFGALFAALPWSEIFEFSGTGTQF